MFTKPFALLFTAAVVLSVSGLSINTPAGLTQCGTVEIKWSGKNSPFILSILPSCESGSEDPLMEFTGINATSYNWTVSLPPSTGPVAFGVTDRNGNEAYTGEVAINGSGNATCLSAASSSAPTISGATTTHTASSSYTHTVLLIPSPIPIPSAPVNAGAGLNSGSSFGSGSNSSSSAGAQTKVNGAIAPAASAFASMIGVVVGFFVL